MLRLENIIVSYNKHTVLNNLCAMVDKGDFITIVGSNGAGKSTLFDLIAGKVKPSSGSVMLDNIDITMQDERQRASVVARLFQNTYLSSVPILTVAQNLALASSKGRCVSFNAALHHFPQDIIDTILKPMGFDNPALLEKQMGQLSGGQRQMISLIMATLIPPKLLLLDEPTAALDPSAATKLLVFIAQFVKQYNITTLMITHDPKIATHMGNKLWVLQDGVIKKEFGQEKIHISTDHLIGEIDYQQLPLVEC